ncbi:MAG: hypothetical protein F9K24_03995 [Leptonema illini]|uniref:Lipoprotein n=1 Tax=Leptonema illini TaxID=183 RepID=A0A833LZR2_9LEPT|nr:MAG: hypothetical protein F9K24_03995 [Leptonema illini]
MRPGLSAFCVFLLGGCSVFLSDNWTFDQRFRGDILKAPYGWSFEFREDRMPVKGVTTEEEILNVYPKGPNLRFTYLVPFKKRIHDRVFLVDRIIGFTYDRYKERGEFRSYVNMESILYYVFLYKGVVQHFTIRHRIDGRQSGQKWVVGRFDTGDLQLGSVQMWPGGRQDYVRYMRQRWESDVRRINSFILIIEQRRSLFVSLLEEKFGPLSQEEIEAVNDIVDAPSQELFRLVSAPNAQKSDVMTAIKRDRVPYY